MVRRRVGRSPWWDARRPQRSMVRPGRSKFRAWPGLGRQIRDGNVPILPTKLNRCLRHRAHDGNTCWPGIAAAHKRTTGSGRLTTSHAPPKMCCAGAASFAAAYGSFGCTRRSAGVGTVLRTHTTPSRSVAGAGGRAYASLDHRPPRSLAGRSGGGPPCRLRGRGVPFLRTQSRCRGCACVWTPDSDLTDLMPPHHHLNHNTGAYTSIQHHLLVGSSVRAPPRPSGVYSYTIRPDPSIYITSPRRRRRHAATMMTRRSTSTSSSTGLAALLALGALTTYVGSGGSGGDGAHTCFPPQGRWRRGFER